MKKLLLLLSVLFVVSCSSDTEELAPVIEYTLTTSVNPSTGGTITPASGQHIEGSIVELTAIPNVKWEFKEWAGDITGTDNPKEIIWNNSITVTAIFEEQSPFYLDENGVTIKARDWVTAGTTGELNGITYEAVDIDTLRTIFNFGPSNWSEYQPAFEAAEERLSKVVTTLITDMSDLFSYGPTSNTADNYYLYWNNFNPDISSWDVSNVTDMSRMFKRKSNYVSIDFYVDVISEYGIFNKDISKWDVSKVTNMSGMFFGCRFFAQDISSWDVSKVTDMSQMFLATPALTQDIGSWDVGNVTNMSGMFAHNTNPPFEFENWDVSKVTNMSGMFWRTTNAGVPGSPSDTPTTNEIKIGSWDVSNVTDMSNMFGGTLENGAWNQLSIDDISNWDVSSVTDMRKMFYWNFSFNQDIGSWDVSKVINMKNMFNSVAAFNKDIGSWDTSSVNDMDEMFSSGYLTLYDLNMNFNQDISEWCVTNITSEPQNFSQEALTEANKPIWGTCPD
jgi:surface protein